MKYALTATLAVIFGLLVAVLHADYGWPALAGGVPFTAVALWDVWTSYDAPIDHETEETPS